MLHYRQIHIASIQETHIDQDLNYPLNGYGIITSDATQNRNKTGQIIQGMKTGGVEIMINQALERHISTTERSVHRLLKLTLHDQQNNIPITILASYAPHKGLGNRQIK